jgi:hypothetical protein
MRKSFLLVLSFLLVGLVGCASTGHKGYDKVLKSLGLTIEECKASCPECKFVRKVHSADATYELWRVEAEDIRVVKSVYLHVKNDRVEKVKPQPDKKKEVFKKKDFFDR